MLASKEEQNVSQLLHVQATRSASATPANDLVIPPNADQRREQHDKATSEIVSTETVIDPSLDIYSNMRIDLSSANAPQILSSHNVLKRLAESESSSSSTEASSSLASTEPSTTPSTSSSTGNKRLKLGPTRSIRSKHVQLPHPLGIKPLGNAFLSGRNDRKMSLGLFAVLQDELILDIFSMFTEDAVTLAKLESVSHAFHVFVNATNTLWRDAFLSAFQGNLERWCGSWKRTLVWHYKLNRLIAKGRVKQGFDGSDLVLLDPPTPRIQSPYLFSDILYHPFRLSMAPLQHLLAPACLHNPITTIDLTKPGSVAHFKDNFAYANQPAIIHGAMPVKDWPCRGWTLENLSQRWPNRFFRCEAVRCRLSTYLGYAKAMQILSEQAWTCADEATESRQPSLSSQSPVNSEESVEKDPQASLNGNLYSMLTPDQGDLTFDPYAVPDESPFYLFDATFADDPHASLEWRVPKIFQQVSSAPPDSASQQDASAVRSDLFSLLGPLRPDSRWIIAGPARSGSGWHKDPNGTSAWNAVLTGRKAWMMLPPHVTPPGVYVSQDEAEVTAPVSIVEWLLGFADETRKLYGPSAPHSQDRVLLEGVCEEGQVLYVPSGWWHLVVNLKESVALTQNFVSPPELGTVLGFMKNKSDQLSGFKKNSNSNSTYQSTAQLAPNGQSSTSLSSSNGDPRKQDGDEEIEECENGAGFEVFELFCDRLGRFDKSLLEKGLADMEVVEASNKPCARLAPTTSLLGHLAQPRSSKASGGDGGSQHATWWETLKKQSGKTSGNNTNPDKSRDTNTDQSNPQVSGKFSFGDSLADEELEEVPW